MGRVRWEPDPPCSARATYCTGHLPPLCYFGEQDRFSRVRRAARGRISTVSVGDAVEDEIAPVNYSPDAAVPVAPHQWIGMGHSSQLGAAVFEFVNERDGAHWIMLGDPFADCEDATPRRDGRPSNAGRHELLARLSQP